MSIMDTAYTIIELIAVGIGWVIWAFLAMNILADIFTHYYRRAPLHEGSDDRP